MKLSQRDQARLIGVRKELIQVITLTAALLPPELFFIVTEGVRTQVRQQQLFADGKSQTMRSRHLTGHAVDLAIWEDKDLDRVVDADELSWKFPKYAELAMYVKKAALQLSVPIVWGGDWRTFKDGPHFELDRSTFP